jgi:hypothetical protein
MPLLGVEDTASYVKSLERKDKLAGSSQIHFLSDALSCCDKLVLTKGIADYSVLNMHPETGSGQTQYLSELRVTYILCQTGSQTEHPGKLN